MGAQLPRDEMLRLALMSSENRAASTLAPPLSRRHARLRRGDERKARALGMTSTHFADPTGLSPRNVSTANDLAQARARRGRRIR